MKEYIDELKKRIIRIILVALVVFSVIWMYSGSIISYIISYSSSNVMTISPLETIETELFVSSVLSVVIIIPYVSAEIYRFISPALHESERRAVKIGFYSVYGSFLLGITALAYPFIKCILFIVNRYTISNVALMVSEYAFVSFIFTLIITCGCLACIPVAIATLTYLNLIKSTWLTIYWRQFVVVSMVFSAIIAPGTDVLSMMLFEAPILLLFGISIIISRFIDRRKNYSKVKTCSAQPI